MSARAKLSANQRAGLELAIRLCWVGQKQVPGSGHRATTHVGVYQWDGGRKSGTVVPFAAYLSKRAGCKITAQFVSKIQRAG